MKKALVSLIVVFLLVSIAVAQEKIYLPLILKGDKPMAQEYPILAINSESGERINLLDEGSGITLADPYWSPNIAQLKGGGTFVNAQTASGRTLVHAEYDNVIETIPLRIAGEKGWLTIRNLRRMLNLSVNAQGYWTQIFEQDRVWLEIRAKGDNFLTGYSSIYTISIPNVTSPYTTPFFNTLQSSQFDTVSIVIEREPFYSPLQPGEIIGPLYNLIKNPDFELWNFGTTDSQPDSWNDLETVSIVGTNNRTTDDVKWGNNALRINVSGSSAIGEAKGITQVIEDNDAGATYTILAWVKNDGVSNGVGRILVTYSDQLELYRDSDIHGWQLYSGTITTGGDDTVGISVEILSTNNNTLGTIYVDSLMFIEGDWTDEAANNLIGYMSSSHIVNHQDQQTGVVNAGDINYIDMWNMPGDIDNKTRLEFVNNTTPNNDENPVEIYRTLRIGMRRTGDIFNFDNYNDPVGRNDTNASSDDFLRTDNLSSDWLEVLSKVVTGPNNVLDNEGRFKVIARIYDQKISGDSNLDIRMRYFVGISGANEVVLPKVDSPIKQNYTVIDLTEDEPMNQDFKFESTTPGQLGYKIEMRRDSGTDKARIDYVMIIPTDGGYFDTNIEPSLTNGNSVIIDSTDKLTITATNRAAGWLKLFNTGDNILYGIKEFRGNIYFGVDDGVWQLKNGIFTKVLEVTNTGGINYLVPLEIFNGRLYTVVNEDDAGTDRLHLYRTGNGTTWNLVGELQTSGGGNLGALAFSRGLTSFKNRLWISSDVTPLDAIIHYYDGDSIVHNLRLTNPPNAFITNFAILNNKLHVVYREDINVLDDATLTWSKAEDFPVFFYIQEFNDKIYGMINDERTIRSYDGSIVTTEATLDFDLRIEAMTIHDNQIYAGGYGLGNTPQQIIFSSDGQTWNRATLQSGTVSGLGSYNGVLYIGEDVTSANATIYTFSSIDNAYSITDYKGGGFSAPNRTYQSDSRHRYFFSYDRENYVNNIDDKALIGIGYRPRYFGLINKDEF